MSNWAIVFEDNEESPVSKMFKSCIYGNRIYFSGGSGVLVSTVKKLINKGYDEILVYIDVVPDNEDTLDMYLTVNTWLSKLAVVNNMKIVLIPIFCIESVVLSLIASDNFGNNTDKRLLEVYLKDIKKFYEDIKGSSIEKKYKSLLNGKMSCCLHNTSGKKSVIGKFYRFDCDCEEFHCYCKCSINEKSERLYVSLPVVYAEEDYLTKMKELSVDVLECDIIGVKEDISRMYKSVCLALNLREIKIL